MAKLFTVDQDILDIANLLRESGVPFKFGCDEGEFQEFIKIAKEKFPDKPYYVVRDWVLWDIQMDEPDSSDSEVTLANDVVLHARFLIEDSYGAGCYGHYRISTPLLEMLDPCFFVTRNSVYILAGIGSRKPAKSKDLDALYF